MVATIKALRVVLSRLSLEPFDDFVGLIFFRKIRLIVLLKHIELNALLNY